MKKWRIIPKVTFTNYRKTYPNMGQNVFTEWFYIRRAWSGRIVSVGVKHFEMSLDFRRNWIADLMSK